MQLELPPSAEGRGPTLATVVEVARILEAAKEGPPLSLAEVGRRMAAKRVRHSAVRASVDFLAQLGFVTRGSRGVQWTHTRDDRFWKAGREGVPLPEEG